MLTALADPPTAADWLSAWSTLGAGIGTVAALFWLVKSNQLAKRALNDERAARQEEAAQLTAERRDAEASQARLVNYLIQVGGEPGVAVHAVVVEVNNDSDRPIHDVTAVLYRRGREGGRSRRRPETAPRIGPGERGLVAFPSRGHPRAPDEIVPWPEGVSAPSRPQHESELVEVDLLFTDAVGLRWRRSSMAQPVRHVDAADD